MQAKASVDDAAHALRKTLAQASLRRIPRHPQHREIVLAIICLGMQRRYPYSEVELNELLQTELGRFNATVDHVTCRRYLVDLGFVKRDRAGTRYLLNFPKVEAALSEQAMACAHNLIAQTLNTSRNRKQTAKGS